MSVGNPFGLLAFLLILLFNVHPVFSSDEELEHGFSEGTLVLTVNRGLIPIESVLVNDLMWAFDTDSGREREARLEKTVTNYVPYNHSVGFLRVCLDHSDNRALEIHHRGCVNVAANHPFFVSVDEASADWVPIHECALRECHSSFVYHAMNQTKEFSAPRILVSFVNNAALYNPKSFNFIVGKYHNYFIFIDGFLLLVHNPTGVASATSNKGLPSPPPLNNQVKQQRFGQLIPISSHQNALGSNNVLSPNPISPLHNVPTMPSWLSKLKGLSPRPKGIPKLQIAKTKPTRIVQAAALPQLPPPTVHRTNTNPLSIDKTMDTADIANVLFDVEVDGSLKFKDGINPFARETLGAMAKLMVPRSVQPGKKSDSMTIALGSCFFDNPNEINIVIGTSAPKLNGNVGIALAMAKKMEAAIEKYTKAKPSLNLQFTGFHLATTYNEINPDYAVLKASKFQTLIGIDRVHGEVAAVEAIKNAGGRVVDIGVDKNPCQACDRQQRHPMATDSKAAAIFDPNQKTLKNKNNEEVARHLQEYEKRVVKNGEIQNDETLLLRLGTSRIDRPYLPRAFDFQDKLHTATASQASEVFSRIIENKKQIEIKMKEIHPKPPVGGFDKLWESRLAVKRAFLKNSLNVAKELQKEFKGARLARKALIDYASDVNPTTADSVLVSRILGKNDLNIFASTPEAQEANDKKKPADLIEILHSLIRKQQGLTWERISKAKPAHLSDYKEHISAKETLANLQNEIPQQETLINSIRDDIMDLEREIIKLDREIANSQTTAAQEKKKKRARYTAEREREGIRRKIKDQKKRKREMKEKLYEMEELADQKEAKIKKTKPNYEKVASIK